VPSGKKKKKKKKERIRQILSTNRGLRREARKERKGRQAHEFLVDERLRSEAALPERHVHVGLDVGSLGNSLVSEGSDGESEAEGGAETLAAGREREEPRTRIGGERSEVRSAWPGE
jgi:hypothetical protein